MSSKKDIQICINPHFDAVSLWIGSWGGEDSPCDISRGFLEAYLEQKEESLAFWICLKGIISGRLGE